ncbi:MAG TPA: metalloregulator ArsR/SmtB family transcription factor [Tepidisphaeraceae bacterium]|jgi:ArsR family transcriptional regulator
MAAGRDPAQIVIARMAGLADPARLRVLHLLEHAPLLVNDLAGVLRLPQSTVSRHLKQLSEHRWLVSRRDGTSHEYRLDSAELDADARALWDLARQQTADWPAVAQDRLRLASLLAARQRDSRTFFAGAARDWDLLRSELFGATFNVDALLSLIDPALVVADLGCGTGAVIEVLAPFAGRVIGIDNSAEMLAAARQRLATATNVALEQAELAALPLADAGVGAALMVLSLSYAADVPAVLAEARRVIAPGGRLVIVDVLTHDRDAFRRQMGQTRMGFSLDEIASALRASGFASVRSRVLDSPRDATAPALFVATGAPA